jgi:hypothetical protein
MNEQVWNTFAASAMAALIERFGGPLNVDEDYGHIEQVGIIAARYADRMTEQFETRFAKQKRSTNLLKGEEK